MCRRGGGPLCVSFRLRSDRRWGKSSYPEQSIRDRRSQREPGGTGRFTSPCDTGAVQSAGKVIIDNLRSVGIVTVIASGNEGFIDGLSFPACISTAVSVGSTTKSDVVSSFSNSASFLSLLAPGESITSSVPGGAFAVESGTSAAAPHVAGAWAILKQAKPAATVSQILTALTSTGVPITDPKNGLTKPRIRVNLALQNLVVTGVSLTPSLPSPQPPGASVLWTAAATGGSAPQCRFWTQLQGGALILARDYSSSNTFLWTPTVAGDYVVIVWAKSTGSTAAFEADRVVAYTIGVSGPQLRFFNNLIVNGQPFTAELRSAQGNIWFSFSGVFSAYQSTQRVLGPFELRINGALVGTFPEMVTLPTTGPQFFTLVLTLQGSQPVLGLLQDAPPNTAEVRELDVGAAVPLQTLEPDERGKRELRYVPIR